MKKVYSNLFLKEPSHEKFKIKNFKWRFYINFFQSISYNFFVFIKKGVGVKFYWFIVKKGLIAFYKRKISLEELNNFSISPLDSFRYFEFHYADIFTKGIKVENYLDISSPRYFPAYLIEKKEITNAYLLNPDKKDIELTKSVFNKLGINGNQIFSTDLIENLSVSPESFDLITSISVLEHIPLNTINSCIKKINSLLKPGGYLVISVPVSATPYEEYINWNEYGLQDKTNSGFYFGQRFHDQKLLDECFNHQLGQPLLKKTSGEKKEGFFIKNRFEKINYITYPHYKESWIFFKNYKEFESLDKLPGIGVSIFMYKKSLQ